MPLYIVKAKGFHGGQMYDPQGKRTTLQTEKPFPKNNMPSWLELAKEGLTPAQKAAATKKANKEAAATKKANKEAAATKKANDIDVDEATFIDDKDVKANNVESLG